MNPHPFVLGLVLGCGGGDGPTTYAPAVPLLSPDATWYGLEQSDSAGENVDVRPGSSNEPTVLIGSPSHYSYFESGTVITPRPESGAYRVAAASSSGPLDASVPVVYSAASDSDPPRYVGDLDSDGVEDVCVLTATRAYSRNLYAADLEGTIGPERAWASIEGDGMAVRGGCSRVADVDGDGNDDLGLAGGLAYGPLPPGPFDTASAQTTFVSDSSGGGLLAGGDDADGDGLADLWFGAQAYDADADAVWEGAVRLVSAPGRGAVSVEGFPVWAGEPGGGVGDRIAVGGDLDGDGLADAFVGARMAETAYVVTDKSGGALVDAHFRLVGPPGTGVSAAIGDVDGDGAADFVFGMSSLASGQIGIFYGPLPAANVASTEADFVGRVGDLGLDDGFGAALAIADVNADGAGDLVVGAPRDSRHAERAGAVYLFLGPLLPP